MSTSWSPESVNMLPWQKELFEGVIKDHKIGRLSWNFRVGPINPKHLYKRETEGLEVKEIEDRAEVRVSILKMEEETMSPGRQVASKSWRRQRNDSPLELPGGIWRNCGWGEVKEAAPTKAKKKRRKLIKNWKKNGMARG